MTQGHSGADSSQMDEAEKSRKRHSIQMELIMIEADYNKDLKEKNLLEAEIRQLRKEEERIKINLIDRHARLEKIDYEVTRAEAELRRLKKELNNL